MLYCARTLILALALGVGVLSLAADRMFAQTSRPANYKVVNVAEGDHLNLRQSPSGRAKILKRVPPNTGTLVATGRSRKNGDDEWVEVTYAGITGWVSSRYVAVVDPQPGAGGQLALSSTKCSRDYRDVKFDDNSSRVRGYHCQGAATTLRIEFHRLSEVVVGSMLMGKPLGTVNHLLRAPKIVRNPVYSEIESLYRKFGYRRILYASDNGMNIGTKIDAPIGGVNYTGGGIKWPPDTPSSTRPGWDIWDITQGGGIIIPTEVPIDIDRAGHRPMSASEYAALSAYMRRVCRSRDAGFSCRRYVTMLEYMTTGSSIPDDLRMILIDPGADGCLPEASLYTRPVIAEAVLVENVSQDQVVLEAIIDAQIASPGRGLRKAKRPSQMGARSVPVDIVLGQNESALIFTRILLGRTPAMWAGGRRLVENEYAYGPEVSVTGLVVKGEKLDLTERSANYLEITASPEGMSCPYLYAWSEEDLKWHNLGKVIDAAQGKDRELTQEIELPSFTTKVRLTEEEVEESFIDQVELRLVLKDGNELRLRPKNTTLAERDGNYVHIAPFRALDIEFDGPPSLASQDVLKASVAITGYYERARMPVAAYRKSVSTTGRRN